MTGEPFASKHPQHPSLTLPMGWYSSTVQRQWHRVINHHERSNLRRGYPNSSWLIVVSAFRPTFPWLDCRSTFDSSGGVTPETNQLHYLCGGNHSSSSRCSWFFFCDRFFAEQSLRRRAFFMRENLVCGAK